MKRLDNLVDFIFNKGIVETEFNKSTTRVTKVVRGNRAVMWITHKNKPDSSCIFLDNLKHVQSDLTFFNLEKLGTIKMEKGDARKEYMVIFEFKR